MTAARLAVAGTLLAGVLLAGTARAHGAEEHAAPETPPASDARFPLGLPEAGSYDLPPIGRVGEHVLVGASGERVPLLDLPPGGAAILSPIYTSCASDSGCPAALAVLARLDRRLAERPALAARVRILTVSFDPERDDLARMAELRSALAPKSDWRFLTAGSPAEIAPLLEALGQDVLPLVTATGEETGLLRHVLKVFLVDGAGRIRNVYSAGFLSDELLLRDLETVLGEEPASGNAPAGTPASAR